MFFRQYNLGCLSLFSYLIGDTTTGRAVVIDPQRDVAGYLADAEGHGLHIERVIETHVHADFLSGHLELAEATGATISYGIGANTDFPIEELADGTRLELGEVVLEVRATPGHTPESISVVVWEHTTATEPWGVLTGDALFLGDVGRPDLLTSVGRTADELARLLYRSLHTQLLTLPDATRVYPAHGAGSACGKELSTATESTIGEQRMVNYALAPMTEDQFVEVVTEGQSAAPPYFAFASDANRRDHTVLDDQQPVPEVSVEAALQVLASGGVVLDARAPETFALGHLRGSINVGLDGRFAEYTGDVVRHDQPVILVTEPGQAAEARTRLARIGFDHVEGQLADIDAVLLGRPDLAAHAERLTVTDLAARQAGPTDIQIIDIRGPGEQAAGLVDGAMAVPLPALVAAAGDGTLDPARPTVVYCAGGYRSSIAASTLRSLGFARVADLLGGIGAWEAAGQPTRLPQG
jgi:hydroxyacylglutathione hydrolase